MSRRLEYKAYAEPIEFEKVVTSFDRSTGSRRKAAAIDMNRFGRSVTNVEAAEIFMEFFTDQEIDPLQPCFEYGVNKAKGLVALYACKADAPGAMPLKWNRHRRTYSFHLGAVFKVHPTVRPTTRIEASFEPILDAEGVPCLAVRIKGAPAKRKEAAETEEMIARAEAEAAKQAAKAAARQRLAEAKQKGKAAKSGTLGPAGAGEG